MENDQLESLLTEVQSLAAFYAKEARTFKEGARPDLASVFSRCERDLLSMIEKASEKKKLVKA
jgi:hypothetical protein